MSQQWQDLILRHVCLLASTKHILGPCNVIYFRLSYAYSFLSFPLICAFVLFNFANLYVPGFVKLVYLFKIHL